jgi:hypothetical protein
MKIRRGAIIGAVMATFMAVGTAFAAAPSLVPGLVGPSVEATQSAAIGSPEASGSAAATETATARESADASPTAAQLARVLDDLTTAGIPATSDELQKLAGEVGLGNAVRIFAFADASGKTTDEILALFQAGKGWGQIVKDLGLTIGPGIGGIMSGGHGNGNGGAKSTDHPVPSHRP